MKLPAKDIKAHHKILILGGGTAGIITANLLSRAGQTDLAIVEPSLQHFYQPLWTLVGAGEVPREKSVRPEARYIPKGATWIQDSVHQVFPEQNSLVTEAGREIHYDYLVVAVGAQLNWEGIPGLLEAIRRGDASSNYDFDLAPKTWQLIRDFQGGTALFHMPGKPVKCPGAPQKIMYLASDYFRRKGLAGKTRVIYGSGLSAIYGVKEYAAVLDRVVERYAIDARFNHELIEILPEKREALFQQKNDPQKRRVAIPYDILHVIPPHQAPDFIRRSSLANLEKCKEGWVTVNKNTLQHTKFANVFALGDVADTPNAKTGAAASRQALVTVTNLLAAMRGEPLPAHYDGYIACPIVTGYGRMLLCEVDYTGKPSPRIPGIDTFRERHDMWLLKKYGLPWLYWNVLLRGRKPPFLEQTRGIPAGLQEKQPLVS
jgi:sulfide:quinone oxidoreductase